MELVDMHQGLVGFPAVGTCVIAGPSKKELHTGSTARAKCRGTKSCGIYTPFVAQGCSNTLCSLLVLRTDHLHVPHERRRSDVEPFATHPLTDGTNLIPRNALLDAMADDDEPSHRAEPESPDELLAMIQFAGTPAL
jgi:hypothetical protein